MTHIKKFNAVWLVIWLCFLSVYAVANVQPLPFIPTQTAGSLFKTPKNSLGEIKNKLLYKALIVIDPGHGGLDVGTQSVSEPRYQEKSFNLVTAQFVKEYLQELGYRILMTRSNDTFVSLEERAHFANENKPILFVSIHYNSAPSAEAHGIEVFFYQSKNKSKRTQQSKQLAQVTLKHVLNHTKAKSRGIKAGNYAVIRETNMPAILIEGGFVTNEAELENLKNPNYLKRLAWGISQGVHAYLLTLRRGV